MRKLLLGAAILFSLNAPAQTLFTYGKDSVSVAEFLQAYRKNNSSGGKDAKAVHDYLDLYIASRLKIKEAKELGYDTLPQLVSEMKNLRQQILPAYEKDAETMNRLVDEAFERSQKDIHLAHIFISFTNASGAFDSTAARKKAMEAYRQLQRGTAFQTVAQKYSDDPSVKSNGGDLGYITVFSLPYELENLAYGTPAGKLSGIYASHAGFHIFKNLGERKAAGRVKAAQILLAFPPESTADQRLAVKKLADSLYQAALQGADFAKLATKYSNDYISSNADGIIPEFGVGQYESAFEKVAFGLKKGEISKPFETSHGYHILKGIELIPVNTDKNNQAALQLLRANVEQSDRINVTREVLARKILKQAKFQQLPFQASQLWAYSDSVLKGSTPSSSAINPNTPLFNIDGRTVKTSEWTDFLKVNLFRPNAAPHQSYSLLWDKFVQSAALDYYKEHLEAFNADFRSQMEEFKDGNLFFEIMQRQVWNPAQTDTAALLQYYQKHKPEYIWDKSAAAVIFYAGDSATANGLAARLRKNPSSWRMLVAELQEKVTADSSRFEWKQIPGAQVGSLKEGTITAPVVNAADNTASFAYIVRVYDKPAPRSFEEARGMVVNNYQNELEQKWVASLKAKYPVNVNEKALDSLMKNL